MSFDTSSPRLVLAGTVYGECRGGGRIGMENIASVVLNRVAAGWGASAVEVCLARRQFSCWDDVNRGRILCAASADPVSWAMALAVADAALGGTLPMRTDGADSYYALSMAGPAYWAKPPAEHVYSDRWHAFWRVHHTAPPKPLPDVSADDLNGAELNSILKGNA